MISLAAGLFTTLLDTIFPTRARLAIDILSVFAGIETSSSSSGFEAFGCCCVELEAIVDTGEQGVWLVKGLG